MMLREYTVFTGWAEHARCTGSSSTILSLLLAGHACFARA